MSVPLIILFALFTLEFYSSSHACTGGFQSPGPLMTSPHVTMPPSESFSPSTPHHASMGPGMNPMADPRFQQVWNT